MAVNYVFLVIAVFSLIPISVSLYYYFKSGVMMFLILGFVFISLFINQSFRFLTELGIENQMMYLALILSFHGSYFSYFYIGERLVKFRERPGIIAVFVYLMYATLLLLIMIQLFRSELTINTEFSIASLGAPYLDLYTQFLSVVAMIYSCMQYVRIDIVANSSSIQRLRWLFVSAILTAAVPPLFRIFVFFDIPTFSRQLFILYAVLMTSYLIIFKPQIVFLSEDQVFQAIKMYNLVGTSTPDHAQVSGLTQLSNYLDEVQKMRPELFEDN